jgi:hypothetical protein
MVTTKVLLNATLNEDANWMTLDLRDFYLKTVLEDPEYMRIHRRQLTASTIQLYNLEDKFDDQQYVYMRLDNCLYGEELFCHPKITQIQKSPKKI